MRAYGEHLGDHLHQAISVQAGCDLTAALAKLIIRATELAQTVELTSLTVLDGLIRFDS